MKKYLKKILIVLFSIVIAVLFSYAVRAQKMQSLFDEELYDNVLRFHVIADSDSPEAQEAKLCIKDGVLDLVSEITADARSLAEAENFILSSLSEIKESAIKISEQNGYDYDIDVTVTTETYPVRYYDGFTFPAGEYRSLRIIIGQGQGKNWWCVIYPSVCTSVSSNLSETLGDAGISSETARYIENGKKCKFEFFLLELFKF